MHTGERRGRQQQKDDTRRIEQKDSEECRAAGEGARDMAPHRDSPSPHNLSSSAMPSPDPVSGMNERGSKPFEPLPDSVAKPSREEIFSFPHSKRVGSYILGRTLGEGAFAKVKEGRHLLTGEKVAVKVIDKKKAKEDPYVAKYMRREAKLMMMVLHPNILKLLEVVETDNSYYLVTEMAEGGDLMDLICKKQFLPEDEVRRFLKQIVSAVDYLHRSNIVHRDLKIENLLLDANRNIKIIDFGLSNTLEPTRSVATLTSVEKHCRTQCGSPAYAAPELLGHSSYGPSVDIWSIGVNMYAMLSGSLPFTVEPFNITELHAKMISNRMNPLPDHIQPSAECRDLLKKLLNPNPEQRISLAEVFKHPWLNQVDDARFCPVPTPNFPRETDLDDRILHHMVTHLNCSMADVARAMTTNRAIHASACYNLMAKRLERYVIAHPRRERPAAAAAAATSTSTSTNSRKVSSDQAKSYRRQGSSPGSQAVQASDNSTAAPATNPSPPRTNSRPERPMEAGAASRRRSHSEGAPDAAAPGVQVTAASRLPKAALAQVQAHDAEATDKCMPLNDVDAPPPTAQRKSGRRWSVSGAENSSRRPQQGMNRSTTTGQLLKPPSRGSSRASPVSPGSPAAKLPETRFSHRALEDGIREAFSTPTAPSREQNWLMADGELPGIPGPVHQRTAGHTTTAAGSSRLDDSTPDTNGWHGRHNPDRHRAQSGPSSKIGRASSFRDELLSRRDPNADQAARRAAVKQNTLFSHTNGDIEPFSPSRRPKSATRRTSADNPRTTSTLPAIPRSITSAGRTRSQKATPGSQMPSGGVAAAGRPHTTAVNGKRASSSNKIVTSIDGLSDLPPDAVIHEVIRVLRNLRVEDWEPRGYETIHCSWLDSQFEISVLEENGMCSLTFERMSSSGPQLSFRDACEQIISALRVYVGS